MFIEFKRIVKEAVFTKREIDNEWNINFLWNKRFGIQHSFQSEFH